MNKEQKIIRLTWKYFLKQKLEEILDYLYPIVMSSIVISIFLIVMGLGLNDESKIGIILVYIGIIIITFWILFGILAIIIHFLKWIKSNWKKAHTKARREVNNGHK